jgi:hypothetical protein
MNVEFRQDVPDDVVLLRRGELMYPLLSKITR